MPLPQMAPLSSDMTDYPALHGPSRAMEQRRQATPPLSSSAHLNAQHPKQPPQTSSSSSLSPLLLSPGRECDSPPSFNSSLPAGALPRDPQMYRDPHRGAMSMDSTSSSNYSSSRDDCSHPRSAMTKTPSLTNSVDTGTSHSSFSSSSNSSSYRYRHPYAADSLRQSSLGQTGQTGDVDGHSGLGPSRHPIHAQSRGGPQDQYKGGGASTRPVPRRSNRATIDDLYELFGERPELSDSREGHHTGASDTEAVSSKGMPSAQPAYGTADVEMERGNAS